MKAGPMLLRIVLLALPAAATGMWLASERETFTKSTKFRAVEVVNDLFGDSDVELRPLRGPIFGYYVGLDAVSGAIVVGAAGAALLGWRKRRRRRAETRRNVEP